jgi:hypothetical protein
MTFTSRLHLLSRLRTRGALSFAALIPKSENKRFSLYNVDFLCFLWDRSYTLQYYLDEFQAPQDYSTQHVLQLITQPCGPEYEDLRLAGRLTSSPGRVNNFNFSISSRPALGSTQPPTQSVSGTLSPGVKRQERDADNEPPTTAEVKKTWIYTSTPHTSS